MVVLNSRDCQGKFKRLKKPVRVSSLVITFTQKFTHTRIGTYNTINPKNVFKPLKYVSEVELQRLENKEIIICQPACLPRTELPLKPVGIWLPYFVQATVILVWLNLSYADEDSFIAPWCCFHLNSFNRALLKTLIEPSSWKRCVLLIWFLIVTLAYVDQQSFPHMMDSMA